MNNFPAKDPAEVVVLAFDFTAELGMESIDAVDAVAVSVVSGSDPAPAGLLYGSPAISGASVTQTVRAGVVGVAYKIKATVSTSAGRTLVLSGVMPVRDL